jgi:ABC-type transport system involved in multi-copper enzyme maturation permease subunit
MTVFIGVGLVAREIDRRSIFALLAKPLPRWEFVVGKYCGLVLTIFVNVAAMTMALYLMLAVLDWRALPTERAAWDAPATDPRLLLAVTMVAAELALLTAVALLFSTFSSSALMSIVFTVGLFVAGLLSTDLRRFGDIVDVSPAVATLVASIGWAVPAFSAFDVKAQIVHGLPLPDGFVPYTLLYAAVYVSAVLAAAIGLFARREFK